MQLVKVCTCAFSRVKFGIQTDQFQCAHGKKCIGKDQVCDDFPQCQDSSDELGCVTKTDLCDHHCDNKSRCLPAKFLCDGEWDCLDGTDEVNCGRLTPLYQVSCLYFVSNYKLKCFIWIAQRMRRKKELKRRAHLSM